MFVALRRRGTKRISSDSNVYPFRRDFSFRVAPISGKSRKRKVGALVEVAAKETRENGARKEEKRVDATWRRRARGRVTVEKKGSSDQRSGRHRVVTTRRELLPPSALPRPPPPSPSPPLLLG